VLLFSLLVSVFAGLLFGARPVFKHAGARLGTGMREGGRGLSQIRERHRAQPGELTAMFVRHGILLTGAGTAIGLAVLLASRGSWRRCYSMSARPTR